MSGLIHRRGLLVGLGALFAAPAIVRPTSIMPVKPFEFATSTVYEFEFDFLGRLFQVLATHPDLTTTHVVELVNQKSSAGWQPSVPYRCGEIITVGR